MELIPPPPPRPTTAALQSTAIRFTIQPQPSKIWHPDVSGLESAAATMWKLKRSCMISQVIWMMAWMNQGTYIEKKQGKEWQKWFRIFLTLLSLKGRKLVYIYVVYAKFEIKSWNSHFFCIVYVDFLILKIKKWEIKKNILSFFILLFYTPLDGLVTDKIPKTQFAKFQNHKILLTVTVNQTFLHFLPKPRKTWWKIFYYLPLINSFFFTLGHLQIIWINFLVFLTPSLSLVDSFLHRFVSKVDILRTP